ncbi:MAG: IPExxxVDY family protein [Bacteroidota bacterium]
MAPKGKFALDETGSPDINCIGLLTDEPDYRVCWLLNHRYNLGLQRCEDLILTISKAPIPQSFTCFMASDNNDNTLFKLISNRSNEGIWLTSFPQINFLLLSLVPGDKNGIVADLRQQGTGHIPEIRGIFELPAGEISSML